MNKKTMMRSMVAMMAILVAVAGGPNRTLGQATLWNAYWDAGHQMLQAGRPAEAERYLEAALHEAEQLDPQSPQMAATLNALGMLYSATGRVSEGESALQRSLQIRVKALGPEHPEVALSLESLALIKSRQGEHKEAAMLGSRALQLKENAVGPAHPEVGMSLIILANIHMVQGNYQEAEAFFRRGLSTFEQSLGPAHPVVAETFNSLGVLYALQDNDVRAEPLFVHALAIVHHTLGPRHPQAAVIMTNYARLLKHSHRNAEALILERDAAAITARRDTTSKFSGSTITPLPSVPGVVVTR